MYEIKEPLYGDTFVDIHYVGNDDELKGKNYSDLAEFLQFKCCIDSNSFYSNNNLITRGLGFENRRLLNTVSATAGGEEKTLFRNIENLEDVYKNGTYAIFTLPDLVLNEREVGDMIVALRNIIPIDLDQIVIQGERETIFAFSIVKTLYESKASKDRGHKAPQSIDNQDDSSNQCFMLNLYENPKFRIFLLTLSLAFVVTAVLCIVALTLNPVALPVAIASAVAGLSSLSTNIVLGCAIGVGTVATVSSGLLAHSLYSNKDNDSELGLTENKGSDFPPGMLFDS
ncbi:MAG: hypothetical protein P1U74_02670 [Legionellaceae bacterium]|nr:hypothetical protein [Legionellaceae bacterium]